ncbi:MAG: ShlB/FhaC/HecB family hemolysin secretion/activation protein [Chlorobiaceae bacterium]|nr:ShlB/FhaC/HecB family hemolysin secretion/activation protein [Chlorobiaceae bacterium]
MMRHLLRLQIVALCSLVLPGILHAAAIPDAGSLIRQLEQQTAFPDRKPKPDAAEPKGEGPETGTTITVSRFVFSGHEGIATDAELQALVTGSVNRGLTMGQLDSLVKNVSMWIRGRGWFLSRAYLPEQDVTDGVVEIRIEQGRVDGRLTYSPDASVRIRHAQLRGMGNYAMRNGGALNMKRLERGLLLMNDLPGIRATAMVSPGSTTGTSALKISVSEGPLIGGTVWGDNMNNRYTGSWRGNALLFLNDPLRSGDQVESMLTSSEAMLQGRVSYVFPLFCDGLKARLSYTGMHYSLIYGELSSLDYSGYSKGGEAGLSYPLLRTRNTNITALAGYGVRTLVDRQGDQDIHDKLSRYGTFGLNGDWYESVSGEAYSTWNIGLTTGVLHENIPSASVDAEANGTVGGFTRVNLGLGRVQTITERTTLKLAWSSQVAFGNLDSSEKFSLGGPNSVRAYPLGEASGDHGHLFNADLRYAIPIPFLWGRLQVGGFYDAGRITVQNDRGMAPLGTATERNTYWLQGVGVGLTYSNGGGLSIRTTWARTIGENPGRSVSGNNYDGNPDRARFWVQAAYGF